ncbi:MAG: hypothetical protein QOF76_4166 [Solirubrobacteraceae bacterium]|nr:hypothetical protein [Solirubrobacteraceae bacterium]
MIARALLAATVAALVGAGSASALTFTVNDTADAVDVQPGDGYCVTAGGTCTLRAAVMEADTANGSVVLVPKGRYVLTSKPFFEAGSITDMDAGNGDLDMTVNMTVRGAGARRTTIDGGGLDRVFANLPGIESIISDMTITGGDSTGGGTSQEIAMGGAIFNMGTMTLERLRLIGNHADGGGAVFSIPLSHIDIRDSLIAGNTAVEGGGIRFDSGGLLENSTVTGNQLMTVPKAALLPDELSGYGGGIDHRGGDDLTIVNSTIAGNHANKGGGGLATTQDYAPTIEQIELGRVRLRNTIIAHNTSDAGNANCRRKAQIIQSTGHNLDSDGTCELTDGTDLPGVDPRLRPLAFHGGPTETLALRRRSPAIDAGGLLCSPADQRGVKRPRRGACDIGAYEYVPRKKQQRTRPRR